MKFLYVDSSVLVAIMFDEPGSNNFRKVLNKAVKCVSSNLLEAEVLSAAAREGIPLIEGRKFTENVSLLFPDRSLHPEYELIFTEGYLKGADAHHLACSLFLDPSRSELHFFSADVSQMKLAKKLGIPLAKLGE